MLKRLPLFIGVITAIISISSGQSCGGIYRNITGSVSSPNHLVGGDYAANLDCTYIIDVPLAFTYTVTIQSFSLENKLDFLYYGFGTDSSDIANARYLTGTGLNGTILELGGREIWFRFITDGSIGDDGFVLSYSATVNTQCNAVQQIISPAANITSLFWPDVYPEEVDCVYRIESPDSDGGFTLTFDAFNISADDYLEIANENNTVVRLNGKTLPKDFISRSHIVVVTFHSQGSSDTTGSGFRMHVMDSNRVPTPKINFVQESLEAGTLLRYTSSNYPNNYADLHQELLTISSSSGQRMIINVFDLDIENKYDTLTISDGNNSLELTGNQLESTPFLTSGVHVTIQFSTDYSGSGRGFALTVQEYFGGEDKEKPSEPPLITTNNYTYSVTSTGVLISSPGYPNAYPDNIVNTWLLTGSPEQRLRLDFNAFDLEYMHDVLVIGTGDDTTNMASRYAIFTGSNLPEMIVLNSEMAWIQLRTDNSNSGKGFSITVTPANECHNEYTLGEGETYDVDYASTSMGYCQWVIRGTRGKHLQLTFTHITLENLYETLEFGRGSNPTNAVSKQRALTGNSLSLTSYQVTDDTVWLAATLRDSVSGFKLQISDDGCVIESLFDEQGMIASPGYPLSYPNDADCIWIIQVTGEYKVHLMFDDFETEEYFDRLIIGGVNDGPDRDYLELSGNSLPSDVYSNLNGLSLRFRSDGTTIEKGFNITYNIIYNCPDGYIAGNDGETCYKFVHEPKSWYEARRDCLQTPYSDLVVIKDPQEAKYIQRYMNEADQDWWIGLSDLQEEESWVWVNCEYVPAGNLTWALTEPTNSTSENCVRFDMDGLYTDDNCTLTFPYICKEEYKGFDSDEQNPSRFAVASKTARRIDLSWEPSSFDCYVSNYQLIASSNGSTFLDMTYDPTVMSVSIEDLTPDSNYTFELVTLTFAEGALEDILTLTVNTDVELECPPSYKLNQQNNKCYKILPHNVTWLEARHHCLETVDADLAIIDSEDADGILDELLQSFNADIWFGLYDWNADYIWSHINSCRRPTYEAFISNETYTEPYCAVKLQSNGWASQPCNNTNAFVCEYFSRDLNETSVNPNFVRVNLLEPTTVQMYWTPSVRLCDVVGYVVNSTKVGGSSTLEYTDGPLSNAKVFYDLDMLAEYTFSVSAKTVTYGTLQPDVVETVFTGVECPLGYEVGYSNNCYKFSDDSLTWEAAREVCEDDDGYLIIINNNTELTYVKIKTRGDNWWIGFNDLVSEANWYWSDCSVSNAWQEGNWAPGQPGNLNDNEHCAQLNDNGRWNDVNCERTMKYICEIPKEGVDKTMQNPSMLSGTTIAYNRVNLTWTPSSKRCELVGYTISQTGARTAFYFIEGGDTSNAMIYGLEPNSAYTFRINANAFYGDLPYVLDESVTLTTFNKFDGDCPYEYEQINGVCYKLSNEALTWTDAKKSCKEDGAVLVIINNQTEKDILMDRTADWWIGLNDQVEEGAYFWGDCNTLSPWQQLQWGDKEPSDVDGNQDCVVMLASGFWNDVSCDLTNKYVCELVDIGYDPADINPTNLMGVASSAFSVTLTWTPSPHNCQVVNYTILYNDPLIHEVIIPGKNSNTTDIDELRSNTEYSFRISAFTALGNVEYSAPIVVTTQNFSSDTCTGDTPMTDITGNITSPNFPVQYPPNANCVYVVALPDINTRVRLRFVEFDLVDPDDYIIITDLNSDLDDPQMVKLSGTHPPKDYLSMTNSVEINFVSGAFQHGSGFRIVYEQEKAALPVSKSCEHTYTLKPGGSLRIQSTNYPNHYPDYENCTWTLKASLSSNIIAVNVFDFNLETVYDQLLFDGHQQTVGDVVPYSIFSESDTLTFTMMTDYSVTGRGFSLAVEEVDPGLVVFKNISMLDSPVTQVTCGGNIDITMASEDIVSPSDPTNTKHYPNSANCLWKIIGTGSNAIVVDFSKFDLEYGYDYVLVGVGDDELDATSIIRRFSGPNVPSKIVLEGSMAWIRFVSDISNTGTGFEISLYNKQRCGMDYMIPDRGLIHIKSDNSPGRYDDNDYCLYRLTSLRGSNIAFTLRNVDIEEGYDFLSFGSGGNPMDSSSRLFSVTGSTSFQRYYTQSNELWITFTSDATNSDYGYIINIDHDACVINSVFGTSGQILSPNYPLDYPNNVDCVWIIQVSGKFHVEVTFNLLNLETGRDFLIIGGITQDPLEDQEIILTGNDLPETIMSTSNGLNIQFISDSSNGDAGFGISWKAIYSCPDGYIAGNDNVTCYRFSSEIKSWLDARDDCLSTPGGDFVIIDDKNENDYIASLTGGDDSWIGFYDRSLEGEWFWVDCLSNTDWGKSNWAPGQPDNGNGLTSANCAKIVGSTSMYDDQDCTAPLKYVCEHYERFYDNDDAGPTRLQAVATTPTSVSLAWRRPIRYCDVLGYRVRYNATNATDVEQGVPGSQTVTVQIENLLPDTTYIFEITSYLNSFGTLPYEESTTVRTIKSVDVLCPDGWVVGPSYTCYKFSDTPRTWSDARNDCLAIEDGDLVVITDQSEHSYIQNMTHMMNTWWIGFYDQATEDSWKWVDCSTPSVWQRSQWASGQPDDTNGQSDCGQMNMAGEWEDEICSKMNNYICEKRKKSFAPDDANPSLFRGQVLNPVSVSFTWRPSRFNCDVTGYKINYQDGVQTKVIEVNGAETNAAVVRDLTPATFYIFSIAATTLHGDLTYDQFRPIRTLNESGVRCPLGYEVGYDYNCFKFSLVSRTWDDARSDCQSSTNSDLAKLDTPEELSYVMNVRNTSTDYWIGYYDVGVEMKWQWIDCTDPSNFTSSNWAPGEPSDVVGNEDCGMLRSDGKYYDMDCTGRSQYVCKVITKDFVPDDFNPRLFTAVSFAPSYALLTWKPTNIYCDITGYRIRYNSTDIDMSVEFVAGALTNLANITNLLPLTTYRFELAAVLTTGALPYQAVAHATTYPEGDPCTRFGDWETGFDGSCYRFVTSLVPISWVDARIECMQVRNGDLALIQTESESDYIKNKTNANGYWIGYFDKAVEGDWRWLDCSPPSTWASSYWLAGEPDDTVAQQNCGYFIGSSIREGFGDSLCSAKYSQFICEISDKGFDPDDVNPSLFRGSALTPNSVELNWRISDIICDVVGYKIEYYDPLRTVVNVPSALIDTVQIDGLQDNTEYTFSIAAFNEIQVLTFDQSTTVKTPLLEDLCPDGWEVGVDYECYKFAKTPMSWQEARTDCKNTSGGDLAIVDTQNKKQYVVDRTQGGDWWLGFHDQGTEGDWSWIDCSSIGLWGETNWVIGQPNDMNGNQDCGEIRSNGLFNDRECNEPLLYVCEIVDNSPDTLAPSKLSAEALSPNDVKLSWTPSSHSCEVSGYKVFIKVDGAETYMNVTGGKSDNIILKSMTASTLYVFTIATYTIDGRELDRSTDSARVVTPSVGICGDTMRYEALGIITSPGYPDDYPDNQDCLYIINIPDAAASIKIIFYYFDLEDGHDFLGIGSGDVADNNIEHIFSGQLLPAPVIIANSKMWIRFFSDEDKTAGGFDLDFSTVFVPTTNEPVHTTLADPIVVGGTLITLMGESHKSFNDEKKLKLAESIAGQANKYCSQTTRACLAPKDTVYKSDNVEYYSFIEVNSNLEVKFWISDPNNEKVAAMTTDQVEEMLSENKDDSDFEYVIGPVKPVPVDSSSLQPWAITLICFFALCMAIIIFVVVRDCNQSSRKTGNTDGKLDLHEMNVAEAGHSATPQRLQSKHTANTYFESPSNSGFKPDTVPDTSIAGASKPTGSDDLPDNLPALSQTDSAAL